MESLPFIRPNAFRGLIALALLAVAGAGCQTMESRTFSGVAVSGLPARLAHVTSLNLDCSSVGETVVRVVKTPEHGVVTVRQGEGYSSYASENPRHPCDFRPTPGTNLMYVSNPGYTGPETVAVDAIFPSGQEAQLTYNLIVK
jgi:hypothetical protein